MEVVHEKIKAFFGSMSWTCINVPCVPFMHFDNILEAKTFCRYFDDCMLCDSLVTLFVSEKMTV